MKTKIFLFILIILLTKSSFAQTFYRGVDLSYVNELEDGGVKYYAADATQTDPYALFATKGANLVRLRLWHNPTWTNYSNLADVKKSIARAKANGQAVLLDFHYSDFWADPSRQWCPAAWNTATSDAVMGDSVYNYTYAVLKALNNEGLLPDMVQIGNETNGNFLIKRTTEKLDGTSPGMFPINWTRQIALLHKGIAAVQQINTEMSAQIKTVIHIAKPENAIWWFKDAVTNGLKGFDIIGISYYPQWSSLNIHEVGDNIKFLKAQYGKEVMIVETGYPWTSNGNDNASNVLGDPSKLATYGNILSTGVQKDLLIELTYIVKENGGSGIIYWEPAWVSSSCKTYWATGSHYENAALFDFTNKLTIGADFLSYDYSQMPFGLADKEVTFEVEMTGQDTQNGVFVTGSFTGTNWTFVAMNPVGNNQYQVKTQIPGRSIGAYIFYNNNVWDNQYKETVPATCAKMWNTHRQYIITDHPEVYSYAWGTCTILSEKSDLTDSKPMVYPSLTSDFLTVKANYPIKSIRIVNLQGQNSFFTLNETGIIDVKSLNPGIYFLRIETKADTQTFKFIKQ